MPVTHTFVSAKSDGADNTLVQPGDWNASHTVTGYRLESESGTFTVGAAFEGAPPTTGTRRVWTAPFACTVTDIQALVIGGTSVVLNAQKNGTDLRTSDATVSAGSDFASVGGSLTGASVASGDDIGIDIVTVTGAVTYVAVQVNLTRP